MSNIEQQTQISPIQMVINARYGNNIKKLVEFAKTIKDRNKRNQAAKEIIRVMKIFNNEITQIEDYEKVLWHHLAILSNYELDIDYPYPIIPLENFNKKPEIISYPEQNIRYRHYGKIIEKLIEKAIEEQDTIVKEELIKSILIQMKRAYILYAHAGNFVKDDIIITDFYRLSKGKLKIPKNFSLPYLNDIKKGWNSQEYKQDRRSVNKNYNNQRKNK